MFTVNFTKKARKGYETLFPKEYIVKVNKLISTLEINPYPAKLFDITKLTKNTYRIRLGRVRIQYIVFEKEKTILVYKIGFRDDSTYKK